MLVLETGAQSEGRKSAQPKKYRPDYFSGNFIQNSFDEILFTKSFAFDLSRMKFFDLRMSNEFLQIKKIASSFLFRKFSSKSTIFFCTQAPFSHFDRIFEVSSILETGQNIPTMRTPWSAFFQDFECV